MNHIKPIRYWNMFYDQTFSGYLVKEEGGISFVAHPICYSLLLHLDRLDEIEKVNLWQLPNDSIIRNSFEFDPIKNSWVFDFPFEDNEIQYLQSISIFFEYVIHATPKTIVKDIEEGLSSVVHSFPKSILRKLVTFVENKFIDDPVRLELLTQPSIQKYLGGD